MARRRLISGPLGAGLALLVVLEAGAGAQDIEAGGRAVEEGGEADRGRLRHDVSPEYRSGAVPSEPIEVEGRFDRAEDHFSREEWAAGIAAIDEILSEATSPDHWRTARLRALRRRRAMERAARDRAARGEEGAGEGEGAAAAGADDRRAGRGPQRDDEEVSDDELVPTVEVYSRDGILYLPVAAAARERLAALPEEARQLYRRTYEAPAERALRSALDLPFAEAVAELRRIAERYPLTDAGTAARREWALRLADGGETLAAAHVLDEGLRSAAARFGPGERPVWLALSSLYHLLAGESREGRLRLETAAEDHSEAAVSVRGRAVLGAALPEHELFVQLEEAARERSAPPSPWPTALGGYARVAEEISPEMLPPLGTEARWIHSVREPLTPQARQRTATGSYPVLQAVAHGDLAIVRSGAKISAIDRRSGKLRWSADPGPPPAPEATSRINIISAVQQSADYFDQGGKALTVFRPSPGARALVVALDHSSPAAFSQSGKAEYSSNHLLAFDAESGKLRWKVSGRSAGGMDARGLAFTAPPAPAGGLLVAPATRDGGYYLVGIDASEMDASVRWISRYYSFSTSYYIRYGSLIEQGSMVAASGGVVYFVPGHGLAGAAEAEGGRLRWLSRYRSRIRLGAGYNPYTGRGGWSNSHPILVRGEKRSWLVAAPRDSDYLTVFDPETGGVVWERTVDGGFSQLVGADRERVYVAGDSVRALAIESGDEVWTSESIGPGAGHGFAAAGRVYLPARGNIVAAIESASGEVVEKYTILDPRVSSEEPINLFPIGGELVALAGWGMAAIRSQSDSWDIVRGRESENLFRNARLLRGSGRHAEAIEILYRLIDEQPKGLLRTKLVKDLLETVSAAADATEDPRFVRELLERGAKLIGSEKARVEWRMREADLVAGSSPEEAAAVWLALLVEQGRTVHTPDGNDADAGIYASERLRELVFPREDADDEARALAERIRSSDAFRSEEEKTRKLLEDASSPAQRLRIAIRRSHAPSAAEAMLSLAADAAARGARDEAAALLDLFVEDYPGLREPEEIEQLRPDPGDAGAPGPVETFRLAELPPRAAAA
ncbi:MAG: PQQ-binding-like beta-propeller repeat protein, partial [Planctomycetes bacterium]|nr:PQQ-binding-like beta-propeller repeat protein [Planctomycetota bacterium]